MAATMSSRVGAAPRDEQSAAAAAAVIRASRSSGGESAGARQYSHNTAYGVGKAALDKMTADMAVELRPRGVSVVSVWPGLVRTELVDAAVRRAGNDRSEIELPGEGRFDVSGAESPRFVGRAVTALATDPAVRDRSGSAVSTSDLAHRYGFTDVNGALPAGA